MLPSLDLSAQCEKFLSSGTGFLRTPRYIRAFLTLRHSATPSITSGTAGRSCGIRGRSGRGGRYGKWGVCRSTRNSTDMRHSKSISARAPVSRAWSGRRFIPPKAAHSFRDYADSANPPLSHRKEAFLCELHPGLPTLPSTHRTRRRFGPAVAR